MNCYLCGKPSKAARCTRCCNELVIANGPFQVARDSTINQVPARIINNLAAFDSRIAVRGHRSRVVSWEHIDTITKGCIDHA